jgi:hypothetical protein
MEASPIGMYSPFRTQGLEKSRKPLGKREIEDEDEFEDD